MNTLWGNVCGIITDFQEQAIVDSMRQLLLIEAFCALKIYISWVDVDVNGFITPTKITKRKKKKKENCNHLCD